MVSASREGPEPPAPEQRQTWPGLQYAWAYDALGNRVTAWEEGQTIGDEDHAAGHATNALNQYTARDVPGRVVVRGTAAATAAVQVNGATAARAGEYFYQELAASNGGGPVNVPVTVRAAVPGAGPGGADVLAETSGSVLVAPTPQTFAYDADGNLTDDGLWTYTWDAENRLIGMTGSAGVPPALRRKLTFAYDYQSRRVAKTVYAWDAAANGGAGDWSTTPSTELRFVYDGWLLLAETTPAGALVRAYTWGLDLADSLAGAGVQRPPTAFSNCHTPRPALASQTLEFPHAQASVGFPPAPAAG